MTLRKFITIHGAMRRFQPNQEEQLVAASRQLAMWDWSKVVALGSQRGAT
jgi:hypothetical protein